MYYILVENDILKYKNGTHNAHQNMPFLAQIKLTVKIDTTAFIKHVYVLHICAHILQYIYITKR